METLPPELVLLIAENLDAKSLVAFSGTNRRLNWLLSNEKRLWKRHLDKIKLPGTNNLQQTSDESSNCPEKDEFLLQTGLRQNWRNGNFRIGQRTQPLKDIWSEKHPGLNMTKVYQDFILWYNMTHVGHQELAWFDAGNGKFGTTRLRLPLRWTSQVEMATKKLAIVKTETWTSEPSAMWGIDISKSKATLRWKTELGRTDRRISRDWMVINKKCLVTMFREGHAWLDVYDAINGSCIRQVHYPILPPGDLYLFGFDSVRSHEKDREVEQDYLAVPFLDPNAPIQFFCLNSCSLFKVPDPTLKASYVDRLGPTDSFVAYTPFKRKLNIITFSEKAAVVREIQVPSRCSILRLLATTSADQTCLFMNYSYAGKVYNVHQFDPDGRETISFETETKDWNLWTGDRPLRQVVTSKIINEDTFVFFDNSSGKIKFVSLDAEGRSLEEVSKEPEFQVPEGFELERIWCLSTSVVAKFTKPEPSQPTNSWSWRKPWNIFKKSEGRMTVFVELKFNPE